MAEQDIYRSHFTTGPVPLDKAAQHVPHAGGAEQDLYNQRFNPEAFDRARESFNQAIPHAGGAEQDLYGSRFTPAFDKARQNIPGRGRATSTGTGVEQDLSGNGLSTIGLLQSAVLPSFNFHAAFSTIAYGVSRYTGRVEGKDWLWPTGITANAWWSAIGTHVIHGGLSVPAAWSRLSYSEKLLLAGVTAWGVRLFQRIASRSVRRGRDDPRYDATKKEPGFWNKALFTMFLPEAAAQTLISLPFVLPFRATSESIGASPVTTRASCWHSLAVFIFSVGFAMEVLADMRLAYHKKNRSMSSLCRDNVWSIVRHPNYLGDALIHASFPILLLGAGLFHPLAALGPIANYMFLRFVGGDRENEESQAERYSKEDPVKAKQFQEYREEKNSFWPDVRELGNKWSWIVVGAGVGGVLFERAMRSVFA
ncbi:hypothetical protein BDW59DRAFT_145960 [Aspergillus cavernicola]|uniref:DUF1295 domain protein n=1 Tax=Aspergillus cavernicola TaxID=176166 RepID=A0ABR4IDN5_9EURO